MKFGFYTLGCKVNQYETQAMERILTDMGHEIGSFEDDCDSYIINTCSVTAVADKKNRAMIRRCRKAHPDAVIGVCGCYTQHAPEAVRELGVDVLGGSGGREAFLADLLATLSDRQQRQHIDAALRRREFEVLPAGGLEERTRAMLKVQDGCVNFCTYCIIPYTRGPVRSAPLELAVEQARDLASRGYREIVVTGIEIASWGVDLPGKPPLTDLLRAVCEAVPGCRVRLGSLEPRIVTEEFCKALKELPNLCPQFHLSMQSGSDSVLARMKRKYNTERYYESVALLNRYFDRPAITTDMITGFPEETEEEIATSLEFIRMCGFAQVHIFPYSIRPVTPAAKMPLVVKSVKEERAKRAATVAEEMRQVYLAGCVGQVYPVLFEQPKGDYFFGHAPNYMEVLVTGENLHNQVKNVRITGVAGGALLGELEEE